jgi:hypothetical protein
VQSQRTLAPEFMLPACANIDPATPVAVAKNLCDALAMTAGEPLVLIVGSLYLIGEALEQLGVAPAPATDERRLNEWTPRPPGAS